MTTIQAIDLLKGLEQSLDDYCELNDEGKTAFRMAITALELFGISEQLPSAQKKGHWNFVGDNLFECTCCGEMYTTQQLNGLRVYDKDPYCPFFCPHCGADMRGEE